MSAPGTRAEWPSDATLRPLVETALAEDVGGGDVTTALTVTPDLKGTGRIIARAPCVVAGIGVVAYVYRILSERFGMPEVTVTESVSDGEPAGQGSRLAELRGNYATMVTGERVVLNLLTHLVGVATLTARFVGEISGTGAVITDTRKTLPGLRALEKYAVRCGGGTNHRRGLDDAILIKENHIAAAGDVRTAVRRVLGAKTGLPMMVEVRTPEEAQVAVEAGAGALLLDNMSSEQIRESVARVRKASDDEPAGSIEEGDRRRDGPRVVLEVSGDLSLDRVRAVATLGVDRLSVGALTHSAPAANLTMLVEPLP